MDFNEEKYSRLMAIYSEEQLVKLAKARVVVAGLGGVGGSCSVALVRGGIGHLVLVDFDVVEESNINRQEFATNDSLGLPKTQVALQRINSINSDVEISVFSEKINENNASKICESSNFIIDAIDDLQAKICLAKYAEDNNIPIVSCMGTALRKDPFKFQFADIYDTSVCPLCKNMRQLCRENEIKHLDVLYSTEPAIKSLTNNLGSTSYIPPIAGMMLAGHAIEYLAGR